MIKVINFLKNETISTHADSLTAAAWLNSKGYKNPFLNFFILKDPTETHKPTVLKTEKIEEKKQDAKPLEL